MRWFGVLAVTSACSPPTTIQDTLLADRDRGDQVAIRAHGWELWKQLASEQPIWDRWASTPIATGRFRTPRPFRNGDVMETEALPVMFDVAFDPHAAHHVAEHRLGDRAVLEHLDEFPAFPADAVAIKLTWYAVKAHGLTTMPIWDGEPSGDANADTTWQRTIQIDPDGVAGVPLASFIYRDLATEADVATARIAAHDPALAIGDHVALVAAHVTTKEIPDWTWQTYWWHDAPKGEADAGRFAADRPPDLHGVAASYLMDATYSTDAPCFNPWLEARFPDGVASNCVTCHQRAVVGAADYLPVTHGRLRADDPYFRGHLATDFIWSVAFEAR